MNRFNRCDRARVALFVFLGACRPTDTQDPQPPMARSSAVQKEAPDDDNRFRLVDAGQEPRRSLRFTAAPGAREETLMTFGQVVERLDGERVHGGSDPVTVRFDLVVEDASEHELVLGFLVGMPSSDAAAHVFARGEIVVDDLGRAIDFAMEPVSRAADGTLEPLDVDPEASPNTRNLAQLTRFIVPLPEEPVGVGAKWTTVDRVVEGGLAIEMTTLHEVLAMRPDGVELRVTETSRLEDARPESPGGVALAGPLAVQRFTARGKSELFLPLGHVLPRADSTLVTEIEMGEGDQGEAIRMTLSTQLRAPAAVSSRR